MARKVTFEGQTYSFPEDASDDEIMAVLEVNSKPRPTAPSSTVPAVQERVKEPGKGANIGQMVANFVTGDNRAQRGVGEIGYQSIPQERDQRFEGPLSPIANALPKPVRNFVGATQKAAAVGAGMFLDPNEESRANIIKKSVPTSEFRRDEYGNLQVRYTPSTPWAYVNRPGASFEDAQTAANEVTKGLTVAKVAPFLNPTRYTGGLVRAGVAGALGGGTMAASQEAGRTFGGEGAKVGDVGTAAIASLAGQGVADVAALGYGAAREQIRKGAMSLADWIDARLAKITPPQPTGEVVIDPKGISARLSQGARNVGTWLDDQARLAAQRGNMGDYALADEFGVPVTRGQAQRNAEQIAREQRFARSGASQEAREVMDRFKQEQVAALRQAGTQLATRGDEPLTENAAQAGVRMAQGLEGRREALKAQADAAYSRAFSQAGSTPVPIETDAEGNAVRGLLGRVNEAVEGDFLDVLDRVPAAQNVVSKLQDQIDAGKATFSTVERARQALNRLSQAANDARDNASAFGIDRVRQSLDDWVEQTLPEAAPNTAGIFDESRQIFREMKQLYGSRGPLDQGGKALEKVLDTPDMSGRSIVDSVLGSDIGARQSAVGAVRRIKEAVLSTTKDGRVAQRPGATGGALAFAKSKGQIPAELQALREAAVYRILAPLERATGETGEMIGDIPIGTIRNNLRRALADDGGAPVMQELFTPDEIMKMRRFLALTEQLTPPPGTVNYSGTAYETSRMVKDGFQRMVEGTLGAGPAVAFNTLWGIPKSLAQGAAARQAITRSANALPLNKTPSVPVGASAYTTTQRNDDAFGP